MIPHTPSPITVIAPSFHVTVLPGSGQLGVEVRAEAPAPLPRPLLSRVGAR
ncbi:MAG: hypothetical protein JNG84_08255 [Archangium sp.]|nr:hypothetical protein [Archangium sp.]